MANIGWIPNTRDGQNIVDCDVAITMTKAKNVDYVCFRFKNSTISVKFHGTEKLMVGYDPESYRIYFAPVEGKGGYGLVGKNQSRTSKWMRIPAKRFESSVQPSALAGNFNLQYDPEERLYYVDITDTVKFQSKKIRTI